MASAAWDGSGTQEDLMNRDECILVVRHVFFFSRAARFSFFGRDRSSIVVDTGTIPLKGTRPVRAYTD